MLETLHRDGRGRVTRWNHGEHQVATPALIIPDTGHAEGPLMLTARPRGDRIELVAGGTWFYPNEVPDGPLVVPPISPAPTDQVQVVSVGEDLAVFHDAGGWAKDPRRMVQALPDAAGQAGLGRALWAPALGTPADYAVWAWLGVDLFDASRLLLAASRGEALTTDGPVTGDALDILGDGAWDMERLIRFNIDAAEQELRRIRAAIATGQLRELAERRAVGHPRSVELLRRFDTEHAFVEATTAGHDGSDIRCLTDASLRHPAVERFRRRLRDQYTAPDADILVILPCSARKPYKTSRSHRWFQRALDESGVRFRCHEVMVTSPLGIVPRELEEVYPAHVYDVPVTGDWSRDEQHVICEQLATIADGRHTKVIAHVPSSTFAFIQAVIPGAIHTGGDHPSGQAACLRLKETLRELRDERRPTPGNINTRRVSDLRAVASFQFNQAAADALTADAQVRGRTPFLKLSGPEGQRGMTTGGRGLLSLTLEGAQLVAPHGTHRVHIGDFQIKKTGSLFAAGIEDADDGIRPGDDVIVTQAGTVVGVGKAHMSATEMREARRGVAVHMRHIVKVTKEAAAV